ncbi:MAG TPA: hypothetical protein VH250_05615, partial [Granulicella sp.]|nr:hypothetical protein [Granulicella sp.]
MKPDSASPFAALHASSTPRPRRLFREIALREAAARDAALRSTANPLDLAEDRRIRSTTVVCVRRGDAVVMAADGQVSLGATVMKGSAKKIRRLYNDKV